LEELLDGGEEFPKREPNLLRCPLCSTILRTRPHHSERWKFPRIEADFDVSIEVYRGQRKLDEFLEGDASVITVKSGGEVRRYVVR